MGVFYRDDAEKITKGKQKPKNLDANNDDKPFARKNDKILSDAQERAESLQKILKNWERNMPQIEKQIRAISKVATYDYESKVYLAKRVIRKYGGDYRLAKKLIDEYLGSS
jgi:hypothetical protein